MKIRTHLTLRYLLSSLSILLTIQGNLFSIDVTSHSDANTPGTLTYAILHSNPGDTIDCTPIAGQIITLTQSLPALTKDLTILGAGVTIDGQNSYCAFQVASGKVIINNINVQNAISKGGDGGDGYSGGGGAVGGGGALYIHGGASTTLVASSLVNNSAQGGHGGATDINGNAGSGGGGGFGGGNGGNTLIAVSTGGGGGGHSNGGNGGSGSSKDGSNGVYFGGGGGGAGINAITPGGNGGNASPNGTFVGGAQSGGNGGGGAGTSEDGFSATGTNGSGIPGNGGNGIGTDLLFGAGGGGGAASETGYPGGLGVGAAGGGGGYQYLGGAGGILGGGGGGSVGGFGGEGGFGAGGGGAATGGSGGGGFGAGGGNGGSYPSGNAGGGGGSGLGGAIFVQKAAKLTIVDAKQISGNRAIAGLGGEIVGDTGSSGQDGAAMGQDIFLRQGGKLIFDVSQTLTIPTPIEGDLTVPADTTGKLIKTGTGILKLHGANTYTGKTTVNQGTLNLNGSINGDMQINPPGILSGNATVYGSIHNHGTISPGNSIGTVFTTDVYFSPASHYRVEVDPKGSSLLSASGTATLGGTLQITQNSGTYSSQGRYTILTALSGLVGSFDSLVVEALPGFQFTLEQDLYNLFLIYQQLPTPHPPANTLEPPSNLKGKQRRNDFGLGYELYNQLNWTPSPSAGVIGYLIYRDGKEIAKVNTSTHAYEDHNRKKGVSYTYAITAFDSANSESTPVTIVIKPLN